VGLDTALWERVKDMLDKEALEAITAELDEPWERRRSRLCRRDREIKDYCAVWLSGSARDKASEAAQDLNRPNRDNLRSNKPRRDHICRIIELCAGKRLKASSIRAILGKELPAPASEAQTILHLGTYGGPDWQEKIYIEPINDQNGRLARLNIIRHRVEKMPLD
jgi:hypothetical protein